MWELSRALDPCLVPPPPPENRKLWAWLDTVVVDGVVSAILREFSNAGGGAAGDGGWGGERSSHGDDAARAVVRARTQCDLVLVVSKQRLQLPLEDTISHGCCCIPLEPEGCPEQSNDRRMIV